MGRGRSGECLRNNLLAAMCTSGLPWAPSHPLQVEALDCAPKLPRPYLIGQPRRPAQPGHLASCPPSPHAPPLPGKTKQAGNSLSLMSVYHAELCGAPTSPRVTDGSQMSQHWSVWSVAPASPANLLENQMLAPRGPETSEVSPATCLNQVQFWHVLKSENHCIT